MSDLERHQSAGVVVERYPEVGYNFRLSDLHAALGLAQLDRLAQLVASRRTLAGRYDAAFAGHETIVPPFVPAGALPNYQSYIVRLRGFDRETRGRVLDAMQERGVATRRGLMAVHLEDAHRGAAIVGGLEHSEKADAETLVLPMYADLDLEDQDVVIAALLEVVESFA